jgi:hypothetical protein
MVIDRPIAAADWFCFSLIESFMAPRSKGASEAIREIATQLERAFGVVSRAGTLGICAVSLNGLRTKPIGSYVIMVAALQSREPAST